MLQEFIQIPGIYFLHEHFFYFLNEDNKIIISRRVFTFKFINFFVFIFFSLIVCCMYSDYFMDNTQICKLFTEFYMKVFAWADELSSLHVYFFLNNNVLN